ncbi:hypothetical protein BJX76DRAFT_161091 [Aspergillus varians]
MTASSPIPSRLFHPGTSITLEDFKKICSRTIDPTTYPLASAIQNNIPIYDASILTPTAPNQTTLLQDEWYHILDSGPGIFILKGMYNPTHYAQTLTATNTAFHQIITKEHQSSTTKKGDHFATTPGTNDRIWNSFTKHALTDPASFTQYYSNPWLRTVSEAWLGPAYRITAQVNIVKPGGPAQESHRDYHLGFQDQDRAAAFPRSVHNASQYLTLQGAVAHSDMPLESGPTRFLPFSQTYKPGYLAWRRDEFREYFRENYTALPLALGDGIFFNPAVFHAAGANETEPGSGPDGGGFHRKANLLQIGSGLGRTMETVEAAPIVERCWGEMGRRFRDAGGVVDAELDALVRAVGDGYPFPTNLDQRPPAPSGMAPESEQEVLLRGLREGWRGETVVGELRRLVADSRAVRDL